MAERLWRVLMACGGFALSTYGAWFVLLRSHWPAPIALLAWISMLLTARWIYYEQLPADCLEEAAALPRGGTDADG